MKRRTKSRYDATALARARDAAVASSPIAIAPIDVAIDRVCGLDRAGASAWSPESARHVLMDLGDRLFEDGEHAAAGFVYYRARHAAGIASPRAFDRLVRAAARRCFLPRSAAESSAQWMTIAKRYMGLA